MFMDLGVERQDFSIALAASQDLRSRVSSLGYFSFVYAVSHAAIAAFW